MMLIPCPWCGERHQSEFVYGGEAHVERPQQPERVSDATWARYLYVRANPRGTHCERWVHRFGCGRWFSAVRHTVTGRFWAVYRIGETPPMPPLDWDGAVSRERHDAERNAKPG